MPCPVLSDCWHSTRIWCRVFVMVCVLASTDARAKRRHRSVAPLPAGVAHERPTADELATEGAACERVDDATGAISAYGRALANDTTHLLSLFRLGSLYRRSRPDLAIVYLRRARAAHPDHDATRRLLEELENTVDWSEIAIPIVDDDGPLPPPRPREEDETSRVLP